MKQLQLINTLEFFRFSDGFNFNLFFYPGWSLSLSIENFLGVLCVLVPLWQDKIATKAPRH